MSDRWFLCPQRRPRAAWQLFCLPHAGAGASSYRGWSAAFTDAVEVHAVQLPGRESRFNEPPAADPEQIAAAIADRADRQFAIFGHSFGGRLGFEVTRALRRTGRPQPRRLYPSAARPPHVRVADGPMDGIADADEAVLVERITTGGGLPAGLLAEPELLELLLPAVRSDLRWLDGYRYRDEPPLAMPIVAFAGTGDPVMPPERMRGWARHTSGPFALHALPGGHFFPHEQLPRLAALIERDLTAAEQARPADPTMSTRSP